MPRASSVAEGSRGEADLAERPHEVGPAAPRQRLRERSRPRRSIALDGAEQEPGKALITCGLRQLRRRDALQERREGAGGRQVPQQAPRL